RDCAGILFGSFTKCEAENPERSLALEQIFEELIVPEHKPAIMNLACGHGMPSMSLPLGKTVEINSISCKINVLD
ncbi:MAG: LD-carboxypeptidase, partial [Clostridiales bacterium]|nr:LD-carboxypeptidase [Clostridiales bacterium]